MKTQSWFASCPRGLESLLLQELTSLGAEEVRETVAGCAFAGPLAVGYRAALWSRLANRVLVTLADVEVGEGEELSRILGGLDWHEWLPEGRSFVVDFSGSSRAVRNTRYGAQLVKDAVVDSFRARGRPRPDVSLKQPDLRFTVRLHRGRAAVSLDFVGESLHRRGYRQEAGKAPLKENLAAAMLLRADWPGIAARGGALIDPLCGSGTLLIEGAMMAADIAPGLARAQWGFEKLAQHNPAQWRAIRKDAESRAEAGRNATLPEIRGYDASRTVVDKALANIERAGLEGIVRVSCKPLKALKQPTHRALQPGLIISNPPYGERLGQVDELRGLYREWGEGLLREFPGWRAAMLTPEKELGMATGLRSHRRYTLYNGTLACQLLLFELEPGNRLGPRGGGPRDGDGQDDSGGAGEGELGPGAEMFANRLRKNLKQVRRWARREGHSCYRVYDADMPEYAVAVDVYDDALHVAEYQAPRSVDPEDAQRRLEDIRQALPAVFDIPPQRIFWKVRQRQRGSSQYQPGEGRGDFIEVSEGTVRLLVNLESYLDTGLFLDHRPLRLRICAESAGKDFLNLFCYTAAASVHAAAGGARSTTSIDLSRTYLDWARRNLALNGFEGRAHRLERADCRQWLADAAGQYDLILLDPPSFSNSKRMEGELDIQRDHPALVEACMRLLRPGGVLYFSNNLRSFRPDPLLDQLGEEISPATIDFDFRRNSQIHRCWRCVKA